MRDKMARIWSTLRHEHFRAKCRYMGVFSKAVFNHFPLEDFFLKTTGIDQSVPQEPISVKTQNRQIARTSPLKESLTQIKLFLKERIIPH